MTNKIFIIKNQKTTYHIVHGANSTECERYASKELQKYLYLSTSTPIPVFSDKCEVRGKEIIIGEARNNTFKKLLEGKSNEAFLIKENDGNIIITGNSPRGVLYGVYKFLEEFIGYRMYASDCESYEKKTDLVIDEKYTLIQDFTFEYREAYWTCAFDANFASKNMLNSNLADLSSKYGGKVKWFNFHHSFGDLVNPQEYFDEHPEYFSLVDGERKKEHTELCLSNPDVYNICLKKLKEWIINNPECDIFSVAQDEWMGHFIKMACECENCKKIDEENASQSGSIITFVNKLADEIKKEYPNKFIHTFAYQYSRKTPSKVVPHDNVIVRLCNIECSWNKGIEEAMINKDSNEYKFYNDLVGWSKITKHLYIWDYAVNYRNYLLPFPNLRTMVKNIELYRKFNVKGILMQGNFSYGGGGYLDELKSYLVARLLRDDFEGLDKTIKDFCDNYYGKEASPYIIEFINLWEDNVYDKKLWLYDDSDSDLFTTDIINKAYALITQALKVSNGEYYDRVDKLMLSMEYLIIVRKPLNDESRNEMLDKFIVRVKKHHITELFERTELEYSFDVMRKSQYAKNRENWYSLYYIMR